VDSVYQQVFVARGAGVRGIELALWRIHAPIRDARRLFLKALERELRDDLGPGVASRLAMRTGKGGAGCAWISSVRAMASESCWRRFSSWRAMGIATVGAEKTPAHPALLSIPAECGHHARDRWHTPSPTPTCSWRLRAT